MHDQYMCCSKGLLKGLFWVALWGCAQRCHVSTILCASCTSSTCLQSSPSLHLHYCAKQLVNLIHAKLAKTLNFTQVHQTLAERESQRLDLLVLFPSHAALLSDVCTTSN